MTLGKTVTLVWASQKNGWRKITSTDFKFDIYTKKENRKTKIEMERRHTQSYEKMWPSRWRLGGQASLETGCQKTLPYVIERLHIYVYVRTYILKYIGYIHTHQAIYRYAKFISILNILLRYRIISIYRYQMEALLFSLMPCRPIVPLSRSQTLCELNFISIYHVTLHIKSADEAALPKKVNTHTAVEMSFCVNVNFFTLYGPVKERVPVFGTNCSHCLLAVTCFNGLYEIKCMDATC
jgi:hypothetical protein